MEEEKHHRNSHTEGKEEVIKIPIKLLAYIGVIVIILVLAFFIIKSGLISGGNVSEKEATAKLMNFFATQVPDAAATFVSASRQGSLYEINLKIDGQEAPVYVTADGKYIVVDRIPLE